MKTKRLIIRIITVIIVLMCLISIFNYSHASAVEQGIKGLIETISIPSLLATPIQWFACLIFDALELLTVGLTLGSAFKGGEVAATMGDVIFNKCGLTSANFFPQVWVATDTVNTDALQNFMVNIGKYYTIMRGLAIAILLGILLYVGIRIAISTVASEKAAYKKMLLDWAVSLLLVFVLHYIIILVFYVNNVLVDILAHIDPATDKDGVMMIKLAAQAAVPRSRMG